MWCWMVSGAVVDFLLIGQHTAIVDLAVSVIGVTAGPDISNSVNTQLTDGVGPSATLQTCKLYLVLRRLILSRGMKGHFI